MKRVLALILSAALVLGLFVLPAGAADSFPDVTDPAIQEPVEVLRQLGVINGLPNGTFAPNGTFTRAEFCKMALTILGRQGDAALQSSRVIFTDVTAAHWALGYVNAAAQAADGGAPLVQGVGDGRFLPNAPITYGSAVAILMRALGYSDQELSTGGVWYAGYLTRAGQIGLLAGLTGLTGESTLTRAQAALLFYNLLFTQPKAGGGIFLTAVLGGKVTGSQLVLELGKALSAGGAAVQTDQDTYRTFRTDLSASLQGRRAQLVLDRDDNVLAIRPDDAFTTRTYRLLATEARYALTDAQEQLIIPTATPVWQAGVDLGTYGSIYKSIDYGTSAIFCYDSTDTLVYIYLTGGGGTGAITAVAGAGSAPFASILGGNTDVSVYKNGVPSSLSAVKQYDVGVYDVHAGTLNVYDRKLTGVYEDAAPSPVSPTHITLMGCQFYVLESALKDLSGFKLGDPMTLLLDGSDRVAGVVSPTLCSAQALGVAEITEGTDDAGSAVFTAKVDLTTGIQVKGTVRSSASAAIQAPGKLVAVTSAAAGQLTLTALESAPVPGSWDLSAGKVGSLTVTPDAALYDKVGNGPLCPVQRGAVTVSTVPAKDILFLHTNAAGQVDAMVLNNVTGDAFTYGILTTGTATVYGVGGLSAQNATVTAANGGGSATAIAAADSAGYKGRFMGLALANDSIGETHRMAQLIPLQSVSARRSAVGTDSVTVNGVTYPLAGNIDQCCYNAATGQWFSSLDAALTYGSQLTLYYDRAPQAGGKVRIIVVG